MYHLVLDELELTSTKFLMQHQKHKTSVIVTKDSSHTLYSERFDATYHSTHGAIQESKHVFIKNGLEFYTHDNLKSKLSILEIGFGTGLNALLTYEFAKQNHLLINYQSIEAFPIPLEIAQELNYTHEKDSVLKEVFLKMHQCESGVLTFINSFFTLIKHQCLIEGFRSTEQFDVIYFDAFSPTQQPELWTESVFENMFSLLKSGGILVTYCAQGQMKRNMKTAGFKITTLPGPPGKREMTRGAKL